MHTDLLKYFAITKVQDTPDGLAIASGTATDETVDSDHEKASYPETAEAYRTWSKESFDSTTAANQEPSLGNCRLQHSTRIAGKLIKINYLDQERRIEVVMKASDSEIASLLRGGYLQGFSHAGRFGRRWDATCGTDIPNGNFCPQCQKTVDVSYWPILSELSVVDRPANPNATFTFVRADGGSEVRKFSEKGNDFMSKATGLSPKELVQSTIRHHEKMAGHVKKLAETERKMAGSAAGRADYGVAKIHEERASLFDTMAEAHDAHVAQLSSARNAVPDTWSLAEATVDANGQPISGKAAGDAGGIFELVFGSWPASPIAKVTPTADLFK